MTARSSPDEGDGQSWCQVLASHRLVHAPRVGAAVCCRRRPVRAARPGGLLSERAGARVVAGQPVGRCPQTPPPRSVRVRWNDRGRTESCPHAGEDVEQDVSFGDRTTGDRRVADGGARPSAGSFQERQGVSGGDVGSRSGSRALPPEDVLVFDEAQRAWDARLACVSCRERLQSHTGSSTSSASSSGAAWCAWSVRARRSTAGGWLAALGTSANRPSTRLVDLSDPRS